MNNDRYLTQRWLKTALMLISATWIASCGGSSNPELLDRAIQAERAGDYRTASTHLRNLAKDDPDNSQAALRLGHVSLAMGNAHEAETQFRRARALGALESDVRLPLLQSMHVRGDYQRIVDETDADVGLTRAERVGLLLVVGSAYQGLGYAAEAEVRFRDVLELAPDSMDAHLSLAQLMVSVARYDDASPLVARMLKMDPAYIPALLLKGAEQERDQRFDAAEKTYRHILTLLGDRRDGQHLLVMSRLAEAQLAQDHMIDAQQTTMAILELHPNGVKSRFLRARIAAQMQDYAFAREWLVAVLRDAPDYRPAQRLLGALYAVEGDLEQAAMYLSLALWSQPNDEFVRQLLAKVRLRQYRPGDARQLLQPLIDSRDHERAHLALAGEASLQAGDGDAALEYFSRSLEKKPSDLRTHLSLVSAYLAAGEVDQAIRMLESLQGRTQQPAATDYLLTLAYLRKGNTRAATWMAEQLVEQHSQPWSSNLLGTVHAAANDPVEARRAFYRAIELDPENIAALANLAKLETRLKQPFKAAAHLRQILSIDPRNSQAMIALARLELVSGNRVSAASWLDRAVQASDRGIVAQTLLARLLLSQGDTEPALKLADRTVVAHASSPQAHALLGDVLLAMNDPQRALASYQQAAELAPNEPTYLVAKARAQFAAGDPRGTIATVMKSRQLGLLSDEARFLLGMAQHAVGKTDDAVRTFEVLIAFSPRNVAALNNLAWLYHEVGDHKAVPTAERAHRVAPANGAVSDTLGWLYTEWGDLERGIAVLTRAVEQSPNVPEIRYHLAVAYARTGNTGVAKTLLNEALQLSGEFKSRTDANELLARL